jgi:TonB dependent receptor
VVDDEMELPIPSTALVLSGGTLPAPQESRTDREGLATFDALPEGLYRLVVTREGFGGVTLEDIPVGPDLVREVTVRMRAAEEWECQLLVPEIVVDPHSTSISRGLDAELLGRLPVGGTVPMVLQALPGAGGALGEYPRISGGAADQSAYVLDGVVVTDPVTGGLPLNLPLNGLETAGIVSGGLLPEHDIGGGGVVHLATREAQNNLDLRTAVAADPAHAWRRVATRLTGPLVRDRAWLALAHEDVATGGADGHAVLAKLTLMPDTSHRIHSTVLANPGGVLGIQRWQWFPSPQTHVDTAVAAQRTHLAAGAASDDRFAANGSSRLISTVRDPIGGTHDLVIGVQASHAAWSVDGARRAASDKLGGYVQDAWAPASGLTFHLGARVDAFELRDGAGDAVLNGVAASPRAGVAWDPSTEGRSRLAVMYGRAVDTGRLTWVDEDRDAAPLMDELVLAAEAEVINDIALCAAMTARRTEEVEYTRWDVGARKILSRRWQADATYSFTARQGHTVRGFLAWDLPTDPFTVRATVFGLYTDVPSAPEPDLLRFLPPEPWIRPGEHGFVGASVLQDLDVPKGYVTLRLEASSAWDPVAPRLLVGAEYAF